MHSHYDVVTLGEPLVEFNQHTPGTPLYQQGVGGDTSNAAIAAARAGARSAILTCIGQDAFGDALCTLWSAEDVDHSAITRDAAHATGVYFVHHDAQGHHFSYLRAGSAASHMHPAWLTQEARRAMVTGCRMLHTSGITLAISPSACDTAFDAMQLAHSAGARVSFDPNLRLKLWPLARARACITQAIALCDLFLPSLDDMVTLTGLTDPDAIVDWSHAQSAALVVLKLGADGVLVAPRGAPRTRIAGHVVQPLDATGAGDCFDGNLLARLALGDDVLTAARYANAAAALAVQGMGAVAPLPRPAQVREILA